MPCSVRLGWAKARAAKTPLHLRACACALASCVARASARARHQCLGAQSLCRFCWRRPARSGEPIPMESLRPPALLETPAL